VIGEGTYDRYCSYGTEVEEYDIPLHEIYGFGYGLERADSI
jgi:hypothetical protein